MKKLLTAFFTFLPLVFFGGMLVVVVLIFGGNNQKEDIGGGDEEYLTNGIAPEIERLRHVFEKYARKEGVYDQLNIIMALTMQESGGRYLDIMQSSESIGLPPNTITSQEYSIQVGVKHFAAVFKKAGGDVRLTLQSYNYGGGFIDYVKRNGGKYTKALALEFSKFQALKLGWRSYGDPNYVDHVFRYLKGGGTVKPVNGAMEGYESVMNEALKYEGNPYEWGGSSPSTGFDCSGLVQWAYRKAGISLPRTAQEQYGATKKITESKAVPGDLVFFTGTYQGKFITHVGIYVGEGRMYNSNDSGVQYSDLKKGYWRDHLVSFGRIKN